VSHQAAVIDNGDRRIVLGVGGDNAHTGGGPMNAASIASVYQRLQHEKIAM